MTATGVINFDQTRLGSVAEQSRWEVSVQGRLPPLPVGPDVVGGLIRPRSTDILSGREHRLCRGVYISMKTCPLLQTTWLALLTAMALSASPSHAVVLHGQVIDDVTGEPVAEFVRRVRPHYPTRTAENWQDHLDATGTTGEFTWDWPRAWEQFVIRIDAEGYQPTVSRVIDRDELRVDLTFRLKPAVPTAGRVVGLDGQPVAGVQIALATVSQNARWQDDKLLAVNPRYQTLSDAAGRFQLPAEVDAFTLIAVADQGYVLLSSQDVKQPLTLHLQPWSAVRGHVLDHRGQPLIGESVDLYRGLPDEWPYLTIAHDMKTDAAGQFIATKVPLGTYQIVHADRDQQGGRVWLAGKIVHLEVAPGPAPTLTLGGEGRPVTGVIVPPDGVTFAGVAVRLTLVPPHWQHASQAQHQAHRRFMMSDAGPTYSGTTATDAAGRFRFEKIPPGQYRLHVAGQAISNPRLQIDPLSEEETDPTQDLGLIQTIILPAR